jgi:hypothetical protein
VKRGPNRIICNAIERDTHQSRITSKFLIDERQSLCRLLQTLGLLVLNFNLILTQTYVVKHYDRTHKLAVYVANYPFICSIKLPGTSTDSFGCTCQIVYSTIHNNVLNLYIRVNIRIIIDPWNAYCIVFTLYYYTYKLLDIEAILSPTTNDGYEDITQCVYLNAWIHKYMTSMDYIARKMNEHRPQTHW